jgi:hypothetical protein
VILRLGGELVVKTNVFIISILSPVCFIFFWAMDFFPFIPKTIIKISKTRK